MAFWNSLVYDNGLNTLTTNVTKIYLCYSEPTTYTEASLTFSLGNTNIALPSPTSRTDGGREIIIPAISGGTITANGIASFYALTSGTILYATGALNSNVTLTLGSTWSSPNFKQGIPGVS